MNDRHTDAELDTVWLAFEGVTKAKPFHFVEVEYFAEQSALNDDDMAEQPWVSELMDIQERLGLGSILALHEGLSVCQEEQIPLPDWLEAELKSLITAVANGKSYGDAKVGRANSPAARIREALRIHSRKDAVRRIRWYQVMEPCLFAFLILPDNLKKKFAGKGYPNLGTTVEDAIEYAVIGLRGTFAQASYETVRKAYFSDDDDGSYWMRTRPDALKIIGNLADASGSLPSGFTEQDIDLPSHLVEGDHRSFTRHDFAEIYPVCAFSFLRGAHRSADHGTQFRNLGFCGTRTRSDGPPCICHVPHNPERIRHGRYDAQAGC